MVRDFIIKKMIVKYVCSLDTYFLYNQLSSIELNLSLAVKFALLHLRTIFY